MLEQGDIVLIPIPFTDLSALKKRPVIVVSNDEFNSTTGELIVVAMTSNPNPTKYSFTIASLDLVEGQLNHPSQIRADKVYTLSQSIVVKRFGKVNPVTLAKIRTLILGLITRK